MKDLSTVELPELRDGRLVVRPWRPDDAAAVAAMCDDEATSHWVPTPYPYTLADGEEWVGDAKRKWSEEHWGTFAVTEAASDSLVGSISVRVDARLESGDIGYLVDYRWRRRGIAVGAVRLLAVWCLDVLDLGRVQIRCSPENEASRRAALACGFQYEGTLRAENIMRERRDDSMVFSLLPSDPRPGYAPAPS